MTNARARLGIPMVDCRAADRCGWLSAVWHDARPRCAGVRRRRQALRQFPCHRPPQPTSTQPIRCLWRQPSPPNQPPSSAAVASRLPAPGFRPCPGNAQPLREESSDASPILSELGDTVMTAGGFVRPEDDNRDESDVWMRCSKRKSWCDCRQWRAWRGSAFAGRHGKRD